MIRARFRKTARRGKTGRRIPQIAYPLLALFLVFPTAAAWTALARLALRLPGAWIAWGPLLAGVSVYVLVQWAFAKPMGLYVFGHEVTHATAAFLSGYKIRSLFVSEKGGEVQLSDTNAIVALAPYCLPIYTLLVLGIYALVNRYASFTVAPPWAGFAVGFTFAFHCALTAHALWQRQPDLHYAGTFFSLVAILFANALVLAVVMKALFPAEMSLASFSDHAIFHTRLFVERTWDFAADLAQRIKP